MLRTPVLLEAKQGFIYGLSCPIFRWGSQNLLLSAAGAAGAVSAAGAALRAADAPDTAFLFLVYISSRGADDHTNDRHSNHIYHLEAPFRETLTS